ncbi:MAG: gas vesicle protein [Acidobacteriota bacterium]
MDDERDLSLLETLDHLLDRGVVIAGEATISIADVDLLYLGLNVVLANVDALTRAHSRHLTPTKNERLPGTEK